MSHIVQIRTEVRDLAAVRAACQRLNLSQPEEGKFKLFSGEATGVAIRLPDWRYPVVWQPTSGELKYDNFEGRWGQQMELDRFQQMYAVEKAKIEARKRGHTVTEQSLADGSIKVTVQLGGAA